MTSLKMRILLIFLLLFSAQHVWSQSVVNYITLPGLDSTVEQTAFFRNADNSLFMGLRQAGIQGWGSTMIKLDPFGVPLSAKRITENIKQIVPCSDNGFLMLGNTGIKTIIKTDDNLNIEWAKKIVPHFSNTMFHFSAEKNGYHYLVATINIADVAPSLSFYPVYTAAIFKIDNNGNLAGYTILADTVFSAMRYNFYPASITISDDGDIYISLAMLGYALAGTCNRQPAIIKLDSMLNVQWAFIYPVGMFNGVSGLSLLNDGTIGLYGDYSNSFPFCNYFKPYFQKIDTSGTLLFARNYSHSFPANHSTTKMIQLDDSTIVFSRSFNDTVAGHYVNNFDHINSNGNIINSQGFDLHGQSSNALRVSEFYSGYIPLSRLQKRDTILFVQVPVTLVAECNNVSNTITDSSLSIVPISFNPVVLSYSLVLQDSIYQPFQSVSFLSSSVCNPTGEANSIIEKGIRIFPNPVLSQFTIEVPEKAGAFTMEIYNASGQLLVTLPFSSNSPGNTMNFEMEVFPKGLYLVRLIGDATVYNERVLKS